ncbi:glycosyltransferase family 2 protein [Sphingomonas sp. C8-2]|jgi:GT2 family glycosyltransferase|nr:glycosyltransferase family 2 protein [Sphingomonas sp. C8-2]
MTFPDIAVVVIGRNEGDRLAHCLRSVEGMRTVYVDSGSSDGSADRARAAGAEVIELDAAGGFSAARGRNAGIERLLADPAIIHVQLLDGDTRLDPGWLAAGKAALDADPALGAVFGRLREQDADGSIYRWMCDLEWAVPSGLADAFGGNVLARAAALCDTGLYRADLIAGEDPDYALRMRARGWRILSLAVPMGIHDSGIDCFGLWWRRTIRAGRGFAALAALHPAVAAPGYARSRARILFWAGVLPLVAVAGLALGIAIDRRWLLLALAALLVVAAQTIRVTARESRRHAPLRAFALSLFLAIGKYAEMIGLLRHHCDRLRGRRR